MSDWVLVRRPEQDGEPRFLVNIDEGNLKERLGTARDMLVQALFDLAVAEGNAQEAVADV